MVETMAAGRRQHDRRSRRRAEQRQRGVDRSYVAEDARTQAQATPGLDVLGDRDLVVGAAFAERKGAGRDAAARLLLESVEIYAVHDVPL
jgi:hypothetical protein